MFESLIIDALFRSGPAVGLPLPSLRIARRQALASALRERRADAGRRGLAWVRAPRVREARRLASLALLGLGLLPQALGRADALHILNVACVCTGAASAVLASPLVLRRFDADLRKLAAVAVPAIAVFVLAQTWLKGMETNYVRAFGSPSDEPPPRTTGARTGSTVARGAFPSSTSSRPAMCGT